MHLRLARVRGVLLRGAILLLQAGVRRPLRAAVGRVLHEGRRVQLLAVLEGARPRRARAGVPHDRRPSQAERHRIRAPRLEELLGHETRKDSRGSSACAPPRRPEGLSPTPAAALLSVPNVRLRHVRFASRAFRVPFRRHRCRVCAVLHQAVSCRSMPNCGVLRCITSHDVVLWRTVIRTSCLYERVSISYQ